MCHLTSLTSVEFFCGMTVSEKAERDGEAGERTGGGGSPAGRTSWWSSGRPAPPCWSPALSGAPAAVPAAAAPGETGRGRVLSDGPRHLMLL